MSPSRGRLALIAILALWLGPALAASPAEKARDLHRKGQIHFDLDKYREALGEFEQAYSANAEPRFLFNIGECHRMLGDRASALRFYQHYLQVQPKGEHKVAAEQRVRELGGVVPAAPPASVPPAAAPAPPPAKPTAPPPQAAAAKPAAPPPPAKPTAPPPQAAAAKPAAPPPPAKPTAPPPLAAQPAPAAAPPPKAAAPPPAQFAPARQVAVVAPPPFVPAPVEPAAVVAAPAAPATPSESPVYRRWWFWTAAAAVVAGVVGVTWAATRDSTVPCDPDRICR